MLQLARLASYNKFLFPLNYSKRGEGWESERVKNLGEILLVHFAFFSVDLFPFFSSFLYNEQAIESTILYSQGEIINQEERRMREWERWFFTL
jgi:hypothetical protein